MEGNHNDARDPELYKAIAKKMRMFLMDKENLNSIFGIEVIKQEDIKEYRPMILEMKSETTIYPKENEEEISEGFNRRSVKRMSERKNCQIFKLEKPLSKRSKSIRSRSRMKCFYQFPKEI